MIRNIIGFPGFGLTLTLNETAFTIFGLNIQWYGILITCGIIIAFLMYRRRAMKTEGISENDVLNIALFTVPIAIIGARVFYVLTNLDKYSSFSEMINIRNGGLAIYGGLVFGVITVVVYCKIKKISFLKVLDAIAPSVPVGQMVGRLGNFFNGEAFGYSENIDSFPWRMTIEKQRLIDGEWTTVSQKLYAEDAYAKYTVLTVHPTFLYEIIWNALGLILLLVFYRKKKADGQMILTYFGWYGLGRGFIEFLRTDSCMLFGQKVFVYLGFACTVIAAILITVLLVRAKHQKRELDAYRELYGESIVLDPFAMDTEDDITEILDSVTEQTDCETDISDDDITPKEPEGEKDNGDIT